MVTHRFFFRIHNFVCAIVEPIPERPKEGPARTVVLTDNSSISDSTIYHSHYDGYYGSIHNKTTKELKPIDELATELLNCVPGDCLDDEGINNLNVEGIGSQENSGMPYVNGVR